MRRLCKNHGFFTLFGCSVDRAGFYQDRQRQPGQLRKRGPVVAVKGQGHQRGPRLDQAQTELLRNAIAKISRAYLGN